MKDAWALLDRRPRITRLTGAVYLGGQLTDSRMEFLRHADVRAVVSLQEERLDPMDGWASHLWLPCPDGRPPTTGQLLLGAQFIEGQVRRGRKVYVHCHGGAGRAPTLCAAYLLRTGLSPHAALEAVHAARPQASMNRRQREAVSGCATAMEAAQTGLAQNPNRRRSSG
jgi:hypothetical protein